MSTRSPLNDVIIVLLLKQFYSEHMKALNKHMHLCVSASLKTLENKYCEDTWCNSTAFNLKNKQTTQP